MYLSIFCNNRAKRNNRVSLTKCMWDSCEKVTEGKVTEKLHFGSTGSDFTATFRSVRNKMEIT